MGIYGGFPKIRGTLLGVPMIRILLSWGLYWGSPILGNYHIVHKGFPPYSNLTSVLNSNPDFGASAWLPGLKAYVQETCGFWGSGVKWMLIVPLK